MTDSVPAPRTGAASSADYDRVVKRMIGDDPVHFAREHWRKSPRLARGVAPAIDYGVEDFLRDLAATHPRPYLSVTSQSGTRYYGRHDSVDGLKEALSSGSVAAMKVSRFWHHPERTAEAWTPMRLLYGALFRAVGMLYLSPQRSEDVDLFLAGPDSQLGTHFDTTDVFTVQLEGRRRWTFDNRVDAHAVLALSRAPDWSPAKEVDFGGSTAEVVLEPGDALYVPAYCVHRVEGVSWSVALSLGLRAANEIDVVEQLLENLRLRDFADFGPLDSCAEADEDGHVTARLEMVTRVRALLARIEAAAVGLALDPLQLPSGLRAGAPADPEAPLSGPYRSGFAVDRPGPATQRG